MVHGLSNELRYAVRSIVRYRALTGAAVACMALGIGASATLFSSVNPWLFRPLPYPRADRLVGVRGTEPERGEEAGHTLVSGPNYLDLRRRATSFAALGAYDRTSANLSAGDVPERVHASRVTASLFPTLQIQPALGRGFSEEEDRSGGPRVALVSHRLWRERFDGDPGVLARTVMLDGAPHAIVGVMPQGFAFPEYADVWTPLGLREDARRDVRTLDVLGRLAEGVNPERAQAELAGIATELARAHPDGNEGRGLRVRPLLDWLTPPGVVMGLKLLLAAGIFVQLIACANIANLLLAKALAQRREVALRLSLGAGRGRLLVQFLAEALVLCAVGSVLGLLAASWGVDLLLGGSPVRPPFWVVNDLDARGLLFVTALTCATALLVALAPLLAAGRAPVSDALREDSRAVAGGPRGRVVRTLVVSELAAALVLLVGAALMVRSFEARYAVDSGLEPRQSLTARLTLSGPRYEDAARRADLLEELARRLGTRAGVVEAGFTNSLPFTEPFSGGWWERRFEVEGRVHQPGHEPVAAYHATSAGALRALGVRVRGGRLFTREEEREGRDVALVSDDLARSLWSGADVESRRVRVGGGAWLRVVGVVGQAREGGDMLLQGGRPAGQIYVPYRREAPRSVSLVLQAERDAASLASGLRETLRTLDPALPVDAVYTLDEVRARASWVAQLWGHMLSQVAALALLLAALGVYGVVSHMASQRRHEIGIRMALGAVPGEVVGLVLRQGLRLALAAVAAGLVGAQLLGGALSRLLYGVSAWDPVTLALCALLLTATVVIASALPAWRAARVDPLAALRTE